MKKLIALTIALLMVLGLFAACSDSGNDSTLKTVESGKLTMSTNAAFPPYEYKDGDKFVGIDVDIATAIAEELGGTLEVVDMEIDALSVSAHKIYGPKGIGALYVKKGTLFEPFMLGGHQENSLRAGTYNTPYIVALGEASKLAKESLEYELSEVEI